MTKKRARGYGARRGRRDFASMTADDIFAAWEEAARAGLKEGLTYAPEIFAPRGDIVTAFKRHIKRRQASDPTHPFNAADYRNSTRVARDVGRICSIMAAADPDHVVRKDVFERAAELAKLHAACPATGGGRVPAGGGRWCEAH